MIDREQWVGAFGLGFMLIRSGDRTFVGHTGGMPGHITGVFTHRESSTGGLVLMNTTSAPDPAAFAIELAGHVIEHDPIEAEPWRPRRRCRTISWTCSGSGTRGRAVRLQRRAGPPRGTRPGAARAQTVLGVREGR